MKTIAIIFGYKDHDGQSQGDVLATYSKAESVFLDAKDRHIFPSGYVRLELYYVSDPSSIALFISDDAARTIQAGDAAKEQIKKREHAKAAFERDAQANFNAANRLFQKASLERNAAVGAVAAIKNQISTATGDSIPKLQKKADELQIKADASAKAFEDVLKQSNVIKNPKSTFDQKQAAYAALGIIKQISQPEAPEAS